MRFGRGRTPWRVANRARKRPVVSSRVPHHTQRRPGERIAAVRISDDAVRGLPG
jgi:hypothetical protein